MKLKSALLLFVALSTGLTKAHSEILWESDFQVVGEYSNPQYQTGNYLYYNGAVDGWTSSGFHSAHALLRDGSDWALMVFSAWDEANSNLYTLDLGFAANTLGVTYWVAFDIGATVYADGGQMTTADELLKIAVIDPSNTVIGQSLVAPGAWSGTQTFHQAYFSYIGTGTGDVRLQIGSGNPGTNRFSGAINNISFQNAEPVPEPSALVAGGAALMLALLRARRKAA